MVKMINVNLWQLMAFLTYDSIAASGDDLDMVSQYRQAQLDFTAKRTLKGKPWFVDNLFAHLPANQFPRYFDNFVTAKRNREPTKLFLEVAGIKVMEEADKAFYCLGYQLRTDGMEVKAFILIEVNRLWVAPTAEDGSHGHGIGKVRSREEVLQATASCSCRSQKGPP